MDSKPNLRNVLEFAREVRVCLRNATVIFGRTMPGTGPPDEYALLPWGTHSVVAIRLDDVTRAVPVHTMRWVRHRAICAAQRAGVFSLPSIKAPSQIDMTAPLSNGRRC